MSQPVSGSGLRAALVALGVCGGFAGQMGCSDHATARYKGDVWFYNLKTHQLFPAPPRSIPPIDTSSGPATGVRAYVYACPDAPGASNQVIAYVEEVTPEARQEIEAFMSSGGEQASLARAMEKAGPAVLVSLPDKEDWHAKTSPEGLEIIKTGRESVGCDRPRLCQP